MLTGCQLLLVGLGGVAAGVVNAIAGGGTLITFPLLTAVGFPAVVANVTNTVALCPGYLGATLAQVGDLQGQKKRLWCVVPAGVIGGMVGGFLLLHTGERVFRSLVPFLILLASMLLAAQDKLRTWLSRRAGNHCSITRLETWAVLPVGLAAIYGGYFGAGLSVIVLAMLGITLDDTLTRLNALKQAVALSVNVSAATLFLFSGKVAWSAAAIMATGALFGGVLGGRLAGRIGAPVLRGIVVVCGMGIAIVYLLR